jgi:hypothetical protein
MDWISKYSLAVKGGGLDLSRSCLNRESRSRHLKKVSLDSWDFLDTLKKDISTDREISISISIGLDCRDLQAYWQFYVANASN